MSVSRSDFEKSLSDFSKSLAPRAHSTCSSGRPVHRASPRGLGPSRAATGEAPRAAWRSSKQNCFLLPLELVPGKRRYLAIYAMETMYGAASAPLRDDTSDAIPATCRHPMLCRRLTGRDGRPRRGSPARRRFSCGQLVRLGRSGQEDHHIRWHTAADAVCAPTQAPVSKSNALLRLLRDAAYLRLSIPMRTLRH